MYTEHTLPNGIRVYLSKLPVYRSASIGVWFKTGSVNEDRSNNGISHFIEHMLFKGTDKRTAKDIAEFFDTLGGDLNAFTSKECTCYHAKVLDKHLPVAIEVIGDMLTNSSMSHEEIEKEKGVVLDEILMADDTPDDVSYDLIAKTIFGNGSLGQPILGTRESVESISQDMILDYMKEYYTVENVVISIAGSFDEQAILDQLTACIALPSKGMLPESQKNSFLRNSAFIYRDIEQVHLEIAYEGISYCSKRIFDLAALNAIIGASVSSRLFQTIRETHGLTYSINSYLTQYENSGLFNLYASMHKDNLMKVMTLIEKELTDVIQTGFTEEEILKVKEQLKGNYILDLEGSESFMNLIGKGKLFNKHIYSIDEVETRINGITLESVQLLANEILSKKPSLTLVGRVDQDILDQCNALL